MGKNLKKIIITGSSGFIGGHLVKKLLAEGHFVVGVDLEQPKYTEPTVFHEIDLRDQESTDWLFDKYRKYDECYNLACLMGGMGYIGDLKHSYDIMVGSTQIVTNVIEASLNYEIKKSFYSSSACVYNMTKQDQLGVSLVEEDAYPAMPDLVYGWQKLFSEQLYQSAVLSHGLNVRVARFHNIFGPESVFDNGKEKAPGALCRKIAKLPGDGEIEVWGDGKQERSFLYIDECLEGIQRLMDSDVKVPINIGSDELVSIDQLAYMIAGIANKFVTIKHDLTKPQGVRGRNSDNSLIKYLLGWAPSQPLEDGLAKTYAWINEQVNKPNENTEPTNY